jgi:hypothetical protein
VKLPAPTADVSRLVEVLEDAGVVEPPRPPPLAALAAGPAAAGAKQSLLRAALQELRARESEAFAHRIEELAYLANVLIAGTSGRQPRPVEALERAIEICNTGLERALGAERSLARAVTVLETTAADQLFRGGYRAGDQR